MDATIQPLKIGTTVGEAIGFIRRKLRILHNIYVVDEANKLVGVLTIRRAIQEENPDTLIEDIMEAKIAALYVDDKKQTLLDNAYWSKFSSLPVVDYNGKFLGAVRYDTYAGLRDSTKTNGKTTDLDAVSHSLSELYGIGFAALVGSTSSLLPDEGRNEK